MSLLEDPEVKKTYDKCKYMVKIWELKFTKKYKRIPSKVTKYQMLLFTSRASFLPNYFS